MTSILRFTLWLLLIATTVSAAPIKALIVDGQNNHDWKATTPVLKKILEDSGLCVVDVATAPSKKPEMASFRPRFADYKVIVSNYNGEP